MDSGRHLKFPLHHRMTVCQALVAGNQLLELSDACVQLTPQPALTQAVLDDQQQIVVVPRLLKVLIQPDIVDGADRVLFVGEPGEQDADSVGLGPLRSSQKLDPVHLGHQEVGDHQVHGPLFEFASSFARIGEVHDLVVGLKQKEALERRDDEFVVVTDEDRGGLALVHRKKKGADESSAPSVDR